jgi:hypothetical protein
MTTAEYVDCQSLPPGSLVDVETKNRHYRIECLGGHEARISGHPEICPEPTPVKLQGSSDKQGVLEPGLISPGRYLQFLTPDRRPVKTSRVLKVRVQIAERPVSIH